MANVISPRMKTMNSLNEVSVQLPGQTEPDILTPDMLPLLHRIVERIRDSGEATLRSGRKFGVEHLADLTKAITTLDPSTPHAGATHLPRTVSKTYRDFLAFHRKNPSVYDYMVERARQAVALGRETYGLPCIFELARWESGIVKQKIRLTDDYELNNNYKAYYARLIMQQEPDLFGFFGVREEVKSTASADMGWDVAAYSAVRKQKSEDKKTKRKRPTMKKKPSQSVTLQVEDVKSHG